MCSNILVCDQIQDGNTIEGLEGLACWYRVVDRVVARNPP